MIAASRAIISSSIRKYTHIKLNRSVLPSTATVCKSIVMANSDRKAGLGSITNFVDPKDSSGEFKRQTSTFRNTVSRESGAEFPAERDRYHLYVSYACPWAHRTLIVRKLKGLEDIISFTSVHWFMGEQGWHFATDEEEKSPSENVTSDPIHPSFTHIRQIYFENDKDYSGRFTVPVLYDKKSKRIVNNESSEIIRIFYDAFDDLLPEKFKKVVLYPEGLRKQIEGTNDWTYNDINNGVYKSGFATKQEAYDKNVQQLFKSLERAEEHLKSQKAFYYGENVTEADVRLYTTVVRFDPVYVQHFKCNLKDIRSGFPAIHRWLRMLYWEVPAFGGTTQFEHIKKHYTKSHKQINQFSITPLGPVPDILPKDKEVLSAEAVKG